MHLARLLDGARPEELALVDDAVAADPSVQVRCGEHVTGVDPCARVVRTEAGELVAYDVLVLATGSVPFVPPVPRRYRSARRPQRGRCRN